MANPNIISGDMHVDGTLTMKGVTLPNNSVTKDKVLAGTGIEYTKLEHLHRATHKQPNSAATAETKAIALIIGATGSTLNFKAGCIAPCTGNATITVDLKKNGTTVLSAPITLDNAQAAYATVSGTITVPGLVAGDVLTVVVAVNAGTGALGTGLFASVNWKEDAQ